jgi:WD40 repeat protein
VVSITFSRDGRIVTASRDKTARVWEAASDASPAVLKYDSPLLSAAFSPDGSRIVTASEDNKVVIWDIGTRHILKALIPQGELYSAAFSQDGSRIIASSHDSLVQIWDAYSFDSLLKGSAVSAKYVAFSPDRSHIVTVSDGGDAATVWRVFPSLQSMIDFATGATPRKLTPEDCRSFYVNASSPVCQGAYSSPNKRPQPRNIIPGFLLR